MTQEELFEKFLVEHIATSELRDLYRKKWKECAKPFLRRPGKQEIYGVYRRGKLNFVDGCTFMLQEILERNGYPKEA